MTHAPGPIEPTRTMTIAGGLYAEVFLPAGAAAGSAKGVVLVSHGYAEHCGRYREVALEGSGHGPHLDRPEAFRAALVAHLTGTT